MKAFCVLTLPSSSSHCLNINLRSLQVQSGKNVSSQYREELREEINTYLIVLCVPAIILALCSIAYFPSHPPKPPSRSSRQERLDFMKGSLELLRNPNSWLIAIVWSIPQVELRSRA